MLYNRVSYCATLIACFAIITEAADSYEQIVSQCQSLNERSNSIRDSFIFAYNGYKKYAYGHDEILPISNKSYDSRNGWGATIIDSLDTLLIMNLEEDYQRALEFVSKVDFSKSSVVSKGFETNIRYLGGLLAANDLRPNPILVQKAIEVADKTLLPLFTDTTSMNVKLKVPYGYMDLIRNQPQIVDSILLAEFGSYSMEFTRLSQVTGDPKYEKLTNDLTDVIIKNPTSMPGLYPAFWTVNPFAPINSSLITVAGGTDSFYEYLIKNYLLQNKENGDLLNTWQKSVESIEKYLLSPTVEDPQIQFVASVRNSTIYAMSNELICFWPGNILLGISQISDQVKRNQYRNFADIFFKSCIEIWQKTNTGIAPESWTWHPRENTIERTLNNLLGGNFKFYTKQEKQKRAVGRTFEITSAFYDLRPETIESIFYYYRLTGDKQYQDLAWELYLAIDKYAKTGSGYARVDHVDIVPAKLQDFQESFFFAETLKYLYLIFADKNCISLNDYIFNTEAHPFKLPSPIQFQ
ncbi:glycoside hydrolase [Cokeromyces recurvatus]|uniref:glycoside hydrolase n=1 Tax=Cokeromyces recurvatus TaxID=90255 RepID=UPI002220DE7C|nr:glycoside hydrolase [Cokeromyces recurvatus]KAI7907019.1 glycoside hydrolase [Cokeromyces recurvatus]